MTIREALAWGADCLKKAGIDNPGLDASLLLAHILNVSRTSLAAVGPDPLLEENFAAFHDLIDRRLNGECIAYILGKKEFRGLDFLVNQHVLVPRPDTETLVEAIQRTIYSEQLTVNNETIKVLDLCTGSGAVAIALKNEMPTLELWATDISAEALEIAKSNAARLIDGRFGDKSILFFHGDLYDALPTPHSSLLPPTSSLLSPTSYFLPPTPLFSLIVCNPPYIPSDEIQTLSAEVKKEPHLALDGGPSGLETINRVIEGSHGFLRHGGSLLLEADPRQMKDIAIMFNKNGFHDIKTYKDLSGQERVIGGIYEN